jgi:hypothetical protein
MCPNLFPTTRTTAPTTTRSKSAMRLVTILTTKRKEEDDDSSSAYNLADPYVRLPADCYDGVPTGVHTIISSDTNDCEDSDVSAYQDVSSIRVQQHTVVEVNNA